MSRSVRYTLILMLLAVGTGLAAVGGWRYARVSAPVNGPIVLISIDTLRADHLPVYGYTKVRTPAIDALAADGVVFDRAYSHAPQTLPSHVSLLTGRLPFETGVRDNMGFSLSRTERTLPQMLHDRGFATAGIVSAFVLRKETGIGRGFDFFDSDLPPAAPDEPIAEIQRDGSESEQIAEHWLAEQSSSRVFLFLHLYEPHTPYTPPARFAEYAPYDGEIAYSDEIVGHLVQWLKAHQLYDRSTIILLSDHGEGLGDHGEQEHGLFLYDEAIHVPLIVKPPGAAGAGRRVGTPVEHIDIVPTVLDLAKAPIPGNLRGRSLKPLLDGSGTIPERPIYSEALYARYHFGWSELTALTDDRYRYIRAPRDELYDLQRDPHERDNLAERRPQARQAMRTELARLAGNAPLQAPAAVSAEDRQRLQALGYVGEQTELATGPAESLPDPKDKIAVLEDYRHAVDLAAERRVPEAIALLQKITADNPGMADVWQNLGNLLVRAGRPEHAVEAYENSAALTPRDISARLAAASTLLSIGKLEAAGHQADLALEQSEKLDARTQASAHDALARIALARKDEDEARKQAALAYKADPTRPLPAYVEAMIHYDHGEYAEAVPLFREAEQQLAGKTIQIAELHYYAGDALARLEQYDEAAKELAEEIHLFPQDLRARTALAMVYRAAGRDADAEQVLTDLLKAAPTPEGYALAARVWKIFGETARADAVRAEARSRFRGDPASKAAK